VKVTRVLHHSLNVEGRLEPTVAFYRDLLHVPEEARPDIPGVGGHWFAAGDTQLHLVDAGAGNGPIRPTGHHVCFAVTDLDAATAELDEAGIEWVGARQGSTEQVWLCDPAGNTIELQQETGTGPTSR
jgi:catechol 2,3-dioxygenase-like lactoylglutathione lyase family enzyme